MNLTTLSLLLLQLRWKQMTIVTDDQKDAESLIYMSDTEGLQRALVSGREALSGEWVYDVVKTGRDSWSPVCILMMCSATCMNAALTQATERERDLGTQTAFGMTSRWLLVSNGSGCLIDRFVLINTTMDNVAVIDTCPSTQRCYKNLMIHTLQWTQGHTRKWTLAGRWNQEQFHHTAHSETADWDQLLFPNSRLGFNGRRIRVIVKEWESYLKVTIGNGTKLWSGLLMDFLNVARDHLNFTYDLIDGTEAEWGTGTPGDADRTFLGYVARREADIGLSNYDTVWERSVLLDTLWPLIISPYVMVYRKLDPAVEYNMPLGPLSSFVVICITVTLTLVSLLLWLLDTVWRSNCVDGNGQGLNAPPVTCWKKLLMLDKVLQIAVAALFSEPSQRRLTSRGGRALLWSWWMLVLVVTAAYSGTLTSFLSVSKQSELFSTPEDLLTKDHGYKWSSNADTTLSFILKNSSLPVYQGLWSGMQQSMTQDPAIGDNITALAEKVRTENFVLFISHLTAISMFGKDCNIVMKDMGIKSVLMSPNLPKGSALRNALSDIVQGLHADGVLCQWIDKWFPRTSCPSAQGPVVISLLHVKGVLLVLPVGLGLAVLVITLEIAYFKNRKTNQQHHCADTTTL